MYGTAKALWSDHGRFPDLTDLLITDPADFGYKAVYAVNRSPDSRLVDRAKLRVLILVDRTLPLGTVIRANPARAVMLVATTTTSFLPGGGRPMLTALADVARRLPVLRMSLGEDPEAVAAAVSAVIRDPEAALRGIRVNSRVARGAAIQQWWRRTGAACAGHIGGIRSAPVASLVAAEPIAARRLTASGVELIESAREPELDALVASSDVVQVHFWNTPSRTTSWRRRAMREQSCGPMSPGTRRPTSSHRKSRRTRLSSWPRATGSPPRSLAEPARIAEFAAPIPPARPSDRRSRPFTVGLFGTLDAARCDPDAVRIFAQVALPGSRHSSRRGSR